MIAAVVQLNSGTDEARNLERAAHWVARAAQAGAELVCLPENFSLLREEGAPEPNPAAEPVGGRVTQWLTALAREHRVVLAGGTLPEAIPGDRRVHNTSLVLDPDGTLRGCYRKVHLFDVELPDTVLCESAGVAAGQELVVADTAVGPLGLSVCYDLRFPELYRELAQRGARALLVPSAFTVPTGRDHWHVLLRARAIENQAFVLAAAQWGRHNQTRHSYGRSLIIDPWGTVLATVPDGEGFAVAELDFARQEEIRRRLPALKHRRLGV